MNIEEHSAQLHEKLSPEKVLIVSAILGGSNMGFNLPPAETISRLWFNEPKNKIRGPNLEGVCLNLWGEYMDSDGYDAVMEECGAWVKHVNGKTLDQMMSSYNTVIRMFNSLIPPYVLNEGDDKPK
jgi:hypothetical protein